VLPLDSVNISVLLVFDLVTGIIGVQHQAGRSFRLLLHLLRAGCTGSHLPRSACPTDQDSTIGLRLGIKLNSNTIYSQGRYDLYVGDRGFFEIDGDARLSVVSNCRPGNLGSCPSCVPDLFA
jgi:hypothetical protein